MNTYRSLVLGFGFASLAGCSTSSSPFGADPDFAAIESRFRSPTGTFDQSKAGSTLASYNDQKKNADSKGSVTGGAGGTKGVSPKATGLALRSMKKLTLANGSSSSYSESSESSSHSSTTTVETDDSTCADLNAKKYSGNCACKNGGSYDYDFESARALETYKGGPIDVIMRAKFNDCAQDEVAVDGPLFVSMHASGAASDGSLSEQRLIMDAKLHGKQGTEEHDLAFTVLVEESKIWMSITVDDGNVVISTSSDWSGESGAVTIRDRDHTYNCSLKDGDGTCTLEDGDKMPVSAKAAVSPSVAKR